MGKLEKLSAVFMALLTAFLLCQPAYSAAARQETEFSAEFTESDNGVVTKGKIYIAAGASRFETNGGDEIIVTRQDKKVMWMIFPRLSRYVESEFNGDAQRAFIDPTAPASGNIERKFLDYEWVDSYRLRKFLVTATYPGGEKDQYHEWFRDNFPIPVKTASLNGKSFFEYSKIKTGPQDPTLFAEPKRYKKATMEEIIALEEKEQGKGKKK